MMVAVLLYACARGLRSSRKIERALVKDVAFRVSAANQAPDHTTIGRFRGGRLTAIPPTRRAQSAGCGEIRQKNE